MPEQPPDPDTFGEAVDHFRARVAISPEAYKTLDARAKRRAFTVSDVAQLDMVTDVWKALQEALENGSTFQEFQAAIGPKLEEAWGGAKPNRVETIFRTNVQMAYGAGRWKQLTKPDTLAMRPVWRLSVVMDTRTSPICSKLAGTTLPADDPFWETHQPPLHFNCRTAVIALTQEQAEAIGMSPETPETDAAEGFGDAPTAEEWSPDLSQYPAALVKIFQGE